MRREFFARNSHLVIRFLGEENDVHGAQTLGVFLDIELHRVSLFESPITCSGDRGSVDENIRGVFPDNESEIPRGIKPLNLSCFSLYFFAHNKTLLKNLSDWIWNERDPGAGKPATGFETANVFSDYRWAFSPANARKFQFIDAPGPDPFPISNFLFISCKHGVQKSLISSASSMWLRNGFPHLPHVLRGDVLFSNPAISATL